MKFTLNPWKWILAAKLFFATRKAAKQKAKDKKDVEDWLNDKDKMLEVAAVAKTFDSIFKGQWFSIGQVQRATNYTTVEAALRILNLLKLSKCLIAEVKGQREMYKITLSEDHRKLYLEQQEKRLSKQLDEIREELKTLQK